MRRPARASGGLTKGDAAILRFLAAAEILETDMWQQYNELAGIQDAPGGEVPGGSGNPDYTEAVAVLDEDMAQYIHDNTDDEISHFTFINAYLKAHGAQTVNLDKFRTLPSSKATGRAADRTADQPDAADDQHQLLDALPQRFAEPRPRRRPPERRPRPRHRPAPGDPAQRRRPRPARPPAGDRQHSRLPLRLDRAGRYHPLRRARPTGHPFRGAADPAQHRRLRDHALPDLAGQSRQRASLDRSRSLGSRSPTSTPTAS